MGFFKKIFGHHKPIIKVSAFDEYRAIVRTAISEVITDDSRVDVVIDNIQSHVDSFVRHDQPSEVYSAIVNYIQNELDEDTDRILAALNRELAKFKSELELQNLGLRYK